jgi:hypothetical protein
MTVTAVVVPMTHAEFRKMALSLPQATESSHMDHPDFRVAGKIFATLGYPDGESGMVKLTALRQAWENSAPTKLRVSTARAP